MREKPSAAEVARLAEPVEADAWQDLCAHAPPSVVRVAGIGALREGDALASRASNFDVIAVNRVFGLGVTAGASEGQLDRLLALYDESPPARVAVQICPTAEPAALTGWVRARGFEPDSYWLRLYARVAGLPAEQETGPIHVEQVGTGEAPSFGRICAAAFDWPAVFGEWMASVVGRPGWHNFMAYEGETPIGTGSILIRGAVGWLGLAATRGGHRRRGSQSALLLRRFRVARDLGCEWLVVETAEDRPDKPAPSYRNLRRMGFEVAYLRPNWIRRRSQSANRPAGID